RSGTIPATGSDVFGDYNSRPRGSCSGPAAIGLDVHLDAFSAGGLDALPIPDGAVENLAVDTVQQAAAHLIGLCVALGLIHDVADELTRLAEIVILGM